MTVTDMQTGETSTGQYFVGAGEIHECEEIIYDYGREYGDILLGPGRALEGVHGSCFEPVGDDISERAKPASEDEDVEDE